MPSRNDFYIVFVTGFERKNTSWRALNESKLNPFVLNVTFLYRLVSGIFYFFHQMIDYQKL